ncbi:DUF1707 SHOCT-like domain-containing protein [Sphaerimonospora thailandensis]|uniref:Cell wall-active antibiotic response 4TMS protein YvqF n=1 Tax=Sphaerimonospora thailandensis TaxID=795644 RepID=A0A8J3R806_9ACTN|nr:DUF1707 domain-containing protein [Sphaerimonospora thailandensis]GIH69540.1 hypothetical protein Mth01_17930 [Sphaerimonospora thailandensis]
MRASDAERESVVEKLREASVEGRLTLAELTERTEAAYLARTHAELAQLTVDLPGGAPAAGPAFTPSAQSARPQGRVRKWIVAVMSSEKRKGKWRIDQEIGAASVMGDVTIDLREAEVRTPEVDIAVTCVMGTVKIIVPDGVDVELSGFAIMGEKKVQAVEPPTGRNAPVVRVNAWVVMGEVKVIGDSRAEPIKRALGAWTDWWLERRHEIGHQIEHNIRHALEHDRQARRDMLREVRESVREIRRDVRDNAREARREARDNWREMRRGGFPPEPPAPPTPPSPPYGGPRR